MTANIAMITIMASHLCAESLALVFIRLSVFDSWFRLSLSIQERRPRSLVAFKSITDGCTSFSS